MKKSFGPKPLIYPTPVWVVGTYDKNGTPNVMTVAYGGICCGQPPCVTVSLRKATYSYGSILHRKAYTVNVPSEAQIAEADYFGIATGRTDDKFAATGLTPVRGEFVDAPYIAEFALVLECRLRHTLEIGRHTQFVGEIVDVKADESILGADGFPDVTKVQPVVYTPSSKTYFGIGDYLGEAYTIGKRFMT